MFDSIYAAPSIVSGTDAAETIGAAFMFRFDLCSLTSGGAQQGSLPFDTARRQLSSARDPTSLSCAA